MEKRILAADRRSSGIAEGACGVQRAPRHDLVGGSGTRRARVRRMDSAAARSTLIAAALAVFLVPGAILAQSAPGAGSTAQTPAAPDPEAAPPPPAPVLVGGEPVIWITIGAGPYTAQYRADRIAQRLDEVVHDRSIQDPSVRVVDTADSSELRVGPRLLMVVTARDAASLGAPRTAIAQQYARDLEQAIRDERWRHAPSTLLRSGLYGLLATLAFGLVVWLVHRLTRWIRGRVEHLAVHGPASLRALHSDVVSPDRMARTIDRLARVVRLVLVLLALDLYLTFVLGLFPWTRAVSFKLLEYVVAPAKVAGAAVIGYLPKFLYVVVIAAIIYLAIKLVALFFHQIERGRLVFPKFPAEWADPTNKIVRVLLIAFGVVAAFPYLPASDSPAFAGVSVFMGILVSLASSSALSNMIAGIVLTYTGAFRIGDRVKLGDAFGDIIETALLATRLRTIKNEDITIPNSLVLAGSVVNYSRNAQKIGLILHTSVTIGYDAPWRKIHDLLIAAALATRGVLHEPKPFVWQTALNDFYVTYEINAFTAQARDMIDIYAELHSRIQDSFFEAGVEIMSPHYTSVRDGNTVAIPEAFRPAGYVAPRFRVENPPVSGVGS
jgi:small-conductance mechanosensitive channel